MKTKNSIVILFILSIALVSFIMKESAEVKHIVVFKYKSGTTQAQIDEVTNTFRDLKNKIPGIISFESGVNNSPEKLNKGFTHIYLLTFKDAASRDAYLPHPDHKKFGDLLTRLGVLEDVFVIDFNPEK